MNDNYKNFPNLPPSMVLYGIIEVAAMLRVSRKTVERLVKQNRIRSALIFGQRRFRADWVNEFVDNAGELAVETAREIRKVVRDVRQDH